MLIEITDHAVIAYQQTRLGEGAAGKTINEEVGSCFASWAVLARRFGEN
jgi:hypothetical protein